METTLQPVSNTERARQASFKGSSTRTGLVVPGQGGYLMSLIPMSSDLDLPTHTSGKVAWSQMLCKMDVSLIDRRSRWKSNPSGLIHQERMTNRSR